MPRFLTTTTFSDFCPRLSLLADLPSSRAELSERAMSLCPVPPGASQNDFGASVLVSATMTRLTTGDLSVRSFEAYIRDFTFVWLIPLSSWASARRSPSAQPTFLSACRFLCRTDSFHSVSSAELCLAHHVVLSFFVLAKRIRGNIPNHRGFRSVGAGATRPRFLMQNRTA